MTLKANPVTLTPYGQAPLGLEGSGASLRPGSIVRVLRTERWVRPTERAGSEGSFICCCPGQRKPSSRTSLRGGADWRSGPRWSILSVLCPVHPFPLRGTSPQGETRDMREKTVSHILHVPFRLFSPFGGCRHHPPCPVGSMSYDIEN